MVKNQRSYTQEFKQQIVDLHNQAGRGISELPREYGIPKGTISAWIKNLPPVQVSETETISMKEYNALQKHEKPSGYQYDQKAWSGKRKEAIFHRKNRWIPL